MSKTPYEVLGVTPNASDDEIKQAYRNLARKYHPDRYTNTDLADLANEKMQEVNAAYDEIQRLRAEEAKAPKTAPNGGGYGYQRRDDRAHSEQDDDDDDEGPGNYNSRRYSADAREKFILIRRCIGAGNITEAERLINEVYDEDRGAEWFFLLGCVQLRKGYYVDASHSFDTAYSMEPGNNEYWQAKERCTSALKASGRDTAPPTGTAAAMLALRCFARIAAASVSAAT